MRGYRNYIFDLYGTLVDIHTDEKKPLLWKAMAGYYNSFGTDYTPERLRTSYLALCREKEEALGKETGSAWPEIELGEVFLDLLEGRGKEIRDRDQWLLDTALAFRCVSRERLSPYPSTVPVLKRLRETGRGIYLLSNAQALFTRAELKVTGIEGFFDGIFLSSDKRIRKPDPAFLRGLLSEYALDPSESVMIGNDFQTDMGIAASCGVDGIFLNTDGHPAWELEKMAGRAGFHPVCVASGDLSEILA